MAVKLAMIFFSMILVNNYVLVQFLGICPFLGVSKKLDSAVGMSAAVIFVMALATTCYLAHLHLFAGAKRHGLSADHCVYPHHRGAGAAG